MTESLLSVIEDIGQKHSSEQLATIANDGPTSYAIEQRMMLTPSLKKWKDAVVTWSGGQRPIHGTTGRWVLQLLSRGASPKQLAASIEAAVKADSVLVLHAHRLNGIAAEKPEYLEPGVVIAPHSVLADDGMKLSTFAKRHQSGYFGIELSDAAALVIEEPIAQPAVHPAIEQDEGLVKVFGDRQAELAARLQTIRRALLMSVTGAVTTPASYNLIHSPPMLAQGMSGQAAFDDPYISTRCKVDLATARARLAELRNFKANPKSLYLAIDRLNRARASHNAIDRAIELGMAMEAILMHGDATGNQEISNKLSNRAAWLLGATIEKRREVRAAATRLYSARSEAVHTGDLKAETLKKYDEASAGDLVTKIVLKVMSVGAYPDWTDLVLGGEDLPR